MFKQFKMALLFLLCMSMTTSNFCALRESCHFDNNSDEFPDWILRLNKSTSEELVAWFKDPNEQVNLIQDKGTSLLKWVLNLDDKFHAAKEALLARSDLNTDIKGNGEGDFGSTVLSIKIGTLLSISSDPQLSCVRSVRHHQVIKLLNTARVPAQIENINNAVKLRLMRYGKNVSLEESLRKLLAQQSKDDDIFALNVD